VDVLVNNAGSGIRLCPLPEMTDDYWDAVMAVNLRSAFLCARAVASGMIERGSGAIVNVSSVVARHPGQHAGPGADRHSVPRGVSLPRGP
jgi:3-oxoacyl-[acyl-carrier protein] reductase